MGQYKRCNNHNQPTCHVYHLQALCDLDLQPFYLSSSYLLMHCLGVLLRYRDNLQLQSHIVEVSKVEKRRFNEARMHLLGVFDSFEGQESNIIVICYLPSSHRPPFCRTLSFQFLSICNP